MRAGWRQNEAGLGWAMVAPAVSIIVLIALFPLGWTFWESLHVHDLRMPWRGRPFVGLANFAEAASTPRAWAALAHTVFFAVMSVALELVVGLALALGLNRAFRGRGILRALVVLPWALPTVVAALIWRFLFDDRVGSINAMIRASGLGDGSFVWLTDPWAAWVPLILADAWKTSPFVALLLLAGLQNIDPSLYEAARVDGAGAWRRLRHITLPLLEPALLVAVLFRGLDALRVFDLVYVLTGGGPGTSTEPLALYTFESLLQNLRFGYGSALSVVIFACAFALAVLLIRWMEIAPSEDAR